MFGSVAGFGVWDRCITRGMPASMFPFQYSNGIQILQAPGYVVINMEMIHEARIVPVGKRPALDSGVKQWLSSSRGHWEGNTLVVETTNFNGVAGQTSFGSPGAPVDPRASSTQMKIVERFERTGPDDIRYGDHGRSGHAGRKLDRPVAAGSATVTDTRLVRICLPRRQRSDPATTSLRRAPKSREHAWRHRRLTATLAEPAHPDDFVGDPQVIQIVHILCLATLFALALNLSLRFAGWGFASRVARRSRRALRAGDLGLPRDLFVSGALLLIAEPFRTITNPVFYLKMGLLVVANRFDSLAGVCRSAPVRGAFRHSSRRPGSGMLV